MHRGCRIGLLRGVGFIFIFGGIIVLAMIWPQLGKWIEQGAVWPYKADSYQISYYCSGGNVLTDWASITWINGNYKTEIGDYGMPFRVSYNFLYGDHVSVTARSGGSFTLRCGIDIDGLSWKSAENSGQDVVVECSGTIGHK